MIHDFLRVCVLCLCQFSGSPVHTGHDPPSNVIFVSVPKSIREKVVATMAATEQIRPSPSSAEVLMQDYIDSLPKGPAGQTIYHVPKSDYYNMVKSSKKLRQVRQENNALAKASVSLGNTSEITMVVRHSCSIYLLSLDEPCPLCGLRGVLGAVIMSSNKSTCACVLCVRVCACLRVFSAGSGASRIIGCQRPEFPFPEASKAPCSGKTASSQHAFCCHSEASAVGELGPSEKMFVAIDCFCSI